MDEVLWSVGRVSGILGVALLTASVLLGVLTRSGRPLPGLPRFAITLAHRNISLLSMVFIVLHVGTLLFDSYAKLNLVNLFLPFFAEYKPFWQGLGTVAFDLLIAVMVTGLFRKRLGVKVFRLVHWSVYAIWPLGLIHAIGNGTDGASMVFLVFSVMAAGSVLLAVLWRLSSGYLEHSKARNSVLIGTETSSIDVTEAHL